MFYVTFYVTVLCYFFTLFVYLIVLCTIASTLKMLIPSRNLVHEFGIISTSEVIIAGQRLANLREESQQEKSPTITKEIYILS